jgi:DNA-binding LacI/PurR family transcriptional regulator
MSGVKRAAYPDSARRRDIPILAHYLGLAARQAKPYCSAVSANSRARGIGRRAVMSDVAKLAGVSHQTVSRVINGSHHVRGETRDRVLAAMRMLDYRPNPVARALVTGRSKTIGVVSFDTTLYGPASTLFGIERAAHEEGYLTSIASVKSLDRPSVLTAVERLRGQAVDGILVIAPQITAAHAVAHLPADLAVVAVEAGPDDQVPVVAVDQFAGAAAATQHLLGLGHATVRHIAGPDDWEESRQRIAGWRHALEAAGAEPHAPLAGDWSARAGYELGRTLVADPDVTALFVANDQMALGVLRVLHETGRDVPRDVSIVGFDDVPEAAYSTPPLTTVRQDFMEMGRRSMHLLLNEIDNGARSTTREMVPAELVVRASTAPA